MTSRVSSSLAATRACFTCSWIGAFLGRHEARAHVHAVGAERQGGDQRAAVGHAARGDEGDLQLLAARGSRMKFGTSSSPGWPPHSKPSTLTASQPIDSAFSEWRTEVHLWITLMPASFSAGSHFCGLLPAVSTILMPPSMID
jgi:hypothetical protein